MPLRCIFVPTGPGVQAERRLEAALRLARHTHAHIDTLFVSPDHGARTTGLNQATRASALPHCNAACEMRAMATVARDTFQRWCSNANIRLQPDRRLDTTFASWREQSGDLETIIALTGRVNDLIVVDNPTKGGPFETAVFDAAVFSSGRPTLILGKQLPDDLLRHVVIAWNGSLEGARVVGQSIALLHEAERISIITIPSDRERETGIADLGHYLHWHGVIVEPAALVPEAAGTVGEKIVALCQSVGATMLVTGAYTHSRLRQAFLGGVTQHILADATLPILMAH